MARTAKNPVERRQELVDAAERLFLRRGYERTAVSDIVRSIRVAQGTFYYYFDSKADVLEAVLEKTFSAVKNALATINGRSDIDPSEKFNKMLHYLFRFNRDKRELFDAAHLDANMILHHKLQEMGHTMLIPHLLDVIEAGVAQGQFHVPCPEETAEILFHAVVHIMHDLGAMSDQNRRNRYRVTLEHLLVSALGIDDDAISIRF